MRYTALLLSAVMSVALFSPSLYAADYTAEGRVVPTGYDGPGLEAVDVAYVTGVVAMATTLGLFDWPIGRMPSMALISAGVLVAGAQRKERIDAERGIPSAAETKTAKVWNGKL